MRVGIAVPYFYPRIGGLENYAYNISIRLAELTNEKVVVFTSYMGEADRSLNDNEALTIIRRKPLLTVESTPVNPSWPVTVSRTISRFKLTHLIAHTPVPYVSECAAFAGALRHIPLAITYHDDIVKREPALNFLYKCYYHLIQRSALESAGAIITTSDRLLARSQYLRGFADKTSIVPPGVDTNLFNPDVSDSWLAETIGVKRKRFVLFVGQMHEASTHKGVDVLLSAFKNVLSEHADAHLVLIGEGRLRGQYSQLARNQLPLDSFTFLGNVPHHAMPMAYRSAEMTVLPSVTSEGFGMALIEAAACGRPSVGTNVGGIPAAIEDGVTGRIVRAGDPIALSEAIGTFLSDARLSRQYGEAGRERAVRLFDWDELAHKTFDILQAL